MTAPDKTTTAPVPNQPVGISPLARREAGYGGGDGRGRGDSRGGQDYGGDRKGRGKGRGGDRDKGDDDVVVVIVVQKIIIINIDGRHAQQRPGTRVRTYGRRKGGKPQRTRTQYGMMPSPPPKIRLIIHTCF